MDSRLIAGAYSQHFRALEREEFHDGERRDSVTKVKRLSQETNKRRKFQAHKRKIEAQREERRRQDILTKRREEQKQATEKYQRSHIPTGSRQNSARGSPRRGSPRRGSPRRQLVPGLDDALKLIRKNTLHESSGRDLLSFNNENEDPMKRAYLFQGGQHYSRPSSGKSTQPVKYEAKAQLMDYSMKNLTSSKSLFEQQLEHQQSLLREQQQKSLKEFNDAVQKELEYVESGQDREEFEKNDDEARFSDSCSSVDSLEKSHGSDERAQIMTNMPGNVAPPVDNHDTRKNQANSSPGNNSDQFYLNQSSSNQKMNMPGNLQEPNHKPLNIDLTPSATFQKIHPTHEHNGSQQSSQVKRPAPENPTSHLHGEPTAPYQMPLKQISTDSLVESESSDSTISLVRIPEVNNNNQYDVRHQSTVSPLTRNQALNNDDSRTDDKQIDRYNNQNASQGQTAWAPNVVSNSHSSNKPKSDPVVETYNPRYASAIGLSIWPGQTQANPNSTPSDGATPNGFFMNNTPTTTNNNNNNSNNLMYPNLVPRTTTTSLVSSVTPSSHPPIESHVADNKLKMNQGETLINPQTLKPFSVPSSTFKGNENNSPKTEYVPVLSHQDFAYPLPPSTHPGHVIQSPVCPVPQTSVLTNLQAEISQLSQQMVQHNQASGVAYPQYNPSNASQISATTAHGMPALPQEKGDHSHVHHPTVPTPAVRTVFPVNRPPVPSSTNICLNGGDESSKKGLQLKDQGIPGQLKENNTGVSDASESAQKEEPMDKETNADPDHAKPLKGILKQLPVKIPAVGQAAGKLHARDSVELARLQNEKKQARKKSVRFAEYHQEETIEEFDESGPSQTGPQLVVKNSYRTTMLRPTSAKTVSSTAKVDSSVKQARSSSAGTRRQQLPASTHAGDMPQTSIVVPDGSSTKINLPANFSQPLNTSAPINRPKAAAHIIMSSEFHNPLPKNAADLDGYVNSGGAATVHKSQLEAKVKMMNNNFMSKVPVKSGAKVAGNPMVYHVSREGTTGGGQVVDNNSLQDQNAQNAIDSSIKSAQLGDRSRIRDPMAKRVPLSNTTVTRTSIVPASTKINYPSPNANVPSYSVSNAQGSNVPVFDENGLRVDRTPTDEEITWLWDKVRNCLDKEEEKAAGNRQSPPNGADQTGRPTPVLSTKLIDGATLGFNSSGAAGLRPGSGYFYPRTGSTNANTGQSKATKPVVQQQGSYLRRYGLLQQRRTNSASSIPTAVAQTRGGSAGFVKYSTVPTSQPQQQPTVQTDMPSPMAFSYRPQDNVSESTAGFMMAERLAKQSLTDSHIALGIEDAQTKQELHNKAKLVAARAVGPSALSMEEQKLMESLDKLNDRLKVTDQKYPGTIHFHQPYQPHLPGFRGHQGLNDSRRQGGPQPAQPRSQSARIRQQIRQYR